MCYKVMYSKNGKRVGSDVFESYDDALSSSLDSSLIKGYLCVILSFNSSTGKWQKRCTIYPCE